MKIENKTSGQVIEVPHEHGTMLLTQGWVEYNEPQQERTVIHEAAIKEEVPQAYRKEEVLKHRGQPKSNRT